MKKERILLLAGNFFPEQTGIGKFNGEMVEWLSLQGHSCTVVTTFPYYPQWTIQNPYIKNCYWFKSEIITVQGGEPIKLIRCPHYIPKNPSGGNRLISEFTFFLTAFLVLFYLFFKKKFSYIISIAPPFEIGLLGLFYKVVKGGKFLYHIQDLQIDAAKDFLLIKSKLIIWFFFLVEKFILKHADHISTISVGMQEKIMLKCKREVLLFPNWVNTKMFYPLYNKKELKADFGFAMDDTVVIYSGSIGHKQGLESILHAAKELESFPNIKFAICGSGPYQEKLIKLKDDLCLQNVFFLPLQSFSTFNVFLNMADFHLIIQKKSSGDLFLPSKLSAILSVGGVAIVTAIKGTSLYNIMSITNLGIVIEPENASALAKAIMVYNESQLEQISKNARSYAKINLASNIILGNFFNQLFVSKVNPQLIASDALK